MFVRLDVIVLLTLTLVIDVDSIQYATTDSARASTTLEFVLSGYCNDDFGWLKALDCSAQKAFVYNKCESWQAPAWQMPCVTFEKLPNVGRESHTFLHHLAKHYDRLQSSSGFMIFLQGQVEDAAFHLVQSHADSWQSKELGFTPLGHVTCAMTYGGVPVQGENVMNNLWYFFHPEQSKEMWYAGFRGQFLVSTKRALRVPKWLYQYQAALLMHEGSSDAHFGHANERLWNVIFGCYKTVSASDALPIDLVCTDSGRGPNSNIPFEGSSAPLSEQEFIQRMTGSPASQLAVCPQTGVTYIDDVIKPISLKAKLMSEFDGLGAFVKLMDREYDA